MLRSRPVLVALVLLGAACGEGAAVEVEAFAPVLQGARGGGPWLQPTLQAAVARARWLRPEADDEVPALPLHLEIGALTDADGASVLRLVAQAEPPTAWQPSLGEEVEAVVEVVPSFGDTLDPAEHGALAVDRAVAILDAKIGLQLDGRAAIETVLAADDPQIVVLGLDWVTDHRAREWGDRVAALVGHPDERVALRAVECLGVVGDARHARALVRLPRLADRAYAQRIYDALARLGGDEARGFLEFAARNEDDPLMMEVASDALARIEGEGGREAERDGATARGHR